MAAGLAATMEWRYLKYLKLPGAPVNFLFFNFSKAEGF